MKALLLSITLTLATISTAFAEQCNTYCSDVAGSTSCTTVCTQ